MFNIYKLAEFNVFHREQQKNHPILNQIYGILAELHGKQIILCKVPSHIVIKGNEMEDKTANLAIDMPGRTTTRLPRTDYNIILGGL